MITERDFFGDCHREAVSADGPLHLGAARCIVFTSATAGRTRVLPDPAGLRWLREGGPSVYVFNRGANAVEIDDHLGTLVTTVQPDKGCVVVLSDEDAPAWHSACFDLHVATGQTTSSGQTGTASNTSTTGTSTTGTTTTTASSATTTSNTTTASVTTGSGTPSAGTGGGEYEPNTMHTIAIEEGL